MFILRIFVMGLIALVPSYNGRDLVLLAPALKAADPQHVPVIIYPCDNAATCGNNAEDISKALKVEVNFENGLLLQGGETFGGVILKGAEVSFAPLPVGELKFVKGVCSSYFGDVFGAIPRTRLDVKDTDWIISMHDVVPKASVIDRRFILSPTASDVAGILRLRKIEGLIKTFGLAKITRAVSPDDQEDFIASLSFKGARSWVGSPRKAAADTIVIEIPISEDQVSVSVRSFDGAVTTIPLIPRNGIVNVLFGNLTPLETTTTSSTVEHLSHFNLYYRLSEGAETINGDELLTPRLGLQSQQIQASIVEEGAPNVIRAVSERINGGGGYHRPICTLVTFSEP